RGKGQLACVEGQRVQRLFPQPLLVGPVEDAASLDAAEVLDLPNQFRPLLGRPAIQAVGRPAEHLGEVVHHEIPLLLAWRGRPREPPSPLRPGRGPPARVTPPIFPPPFPRPPR